MEEGMATSAVADFWGTQAILALIQTVRESDENAERRHKELLDVLKNDPKKNKERIFERKYVGSDDHNGI